MSVYRIFFVICFLGGWFHSELSQAWNEAVPVVSDADIVWIFDVILQQNKLDLIPFGAVPLEEFF